ncbi:DEAD/DEAH box helicase family protein [Synergistaceae bacterium OttesenSCG-928-I11]|nr:DEAD/DEAH box helicase family protein [Synergistaceae bacterium OttesenSCG-928-I11]
MLKEPYSPKSYSYHSKYIDNRLALRPPQKESLERFARIVDILSLSKTPDLAEELRKIRELFPKLTSFERDFPSVCFALATGIGKTRLMGAMIAYLHYEKGVRNFFVMAPNLTIYKKLKNDLGNPDNEKYVFRGLDKFVAVPWIIDGDNYTEFRQASLFDDNVTINVFNISKLNSESGRMRRLQEVLGQSYFSYLQSLPDLCIFMDESHHFHADRGFDTINELHPILGVELTATPQIQKGTRKIDFKNVVYEYSLAHALNDGLYVKVPAVFTRRDFRSEEYTPQQLDREKLNDGIRLHEETKSRLDIYARTHGKPIVKPFVLVVAKDTNHSREIREYLTSDAFFRGYYKDKVLEINSAQRGSEKDENIERLLSLELASNVIEIVIHVNMLKEGWDVTNLYTIIPLRASASETLTEQTIGRGLRLPYGQRTGVDEIDRLSIVSHDRYQAIVDLARDPNSLVRKVYYIEEQNIPENDEERETVYLPTVYDTVTSGENFTQQLVFTLLETATDEYKTGKKLDQTQRIASVVQSTTAQTVVEVNRQVRSINAINDEYTRKFVHSSIVSQVIRQLPELDIKEEDLAAVVDVAIETCAQALTENVIPIPQSVIQPHTEVKRGFYDFSLETRNMNWHPSDDTLLGTELQEGGETFTLETDKVAFAKVDTVDNEIVRHIIVHDNVDYANCSNLIYSLIADAKRHFLSYLSDEEAEKVMRDRQRTIAEIIYAQMNEHFYKEEVSYKAANMRPFTRIEPSFGGKFKTDEIYDLRTPMVASDVKSKIFSGFRKAGHTLYKFHSDTERTFAVVLENDNAVLRWLRPAPRQFNIYWGPGGVSRYEPDFIVETVSKIYMCEPKASNKMRDADVLEKQIAAEEYCRAASEFNADNGGKPWKYLLISHDEIRPQSSFSYLAKQASQKQLPID